MDTRDLSQDAVAVVLAAMPEELAELRKNPPPGCVLVRTGVGESNATRGLISIADRSRVRIVIHIGFAGALSANIHVGDLVAARRVSGSYSGTLPAESLDAVSGLNLGSVAVHFGTAVTVSSFLTKAADKRELAATLESGETAWADMESAGVARICTQRGIPLVIVRAVTDVLDEGLPLDFNRCRRPDGDLNRGKVVLMALTHPLRIGGLIEMRRRSVLCSKRLAAAVRKLIERTISAPA